MTELPLGRASTRSLVEEVAERIREAILSGTLKPEQHLREEQLAVALEVSRGPVRAALMQLEHEGLVIARRNRGYIVARLSLKDLDEVYTLRLTLERLSVQYACHNATDEDFAAMEQIVQGFEKMAERGISEREAADLDISFHDLLFRSAHHERLYTHWTRLRAQVHIFLLSRNVASIGSREMANSHRLLLDCVRSRDESRSLEAIDVHLKWAYLRIVGNYTGTELSATTFPLTLFSPISKR